MVTIIFIAHCNLNIKSYHIIIIMISISLPYHYDLHIIITSLYHQYNLHIGIAVVQKVADLHAEGVKIVQTLFLCSVFEINFVVSNRC